MCRRHTVEFKISIALNLKIVSNVNLASIRIISRIFVSRYSWEIVTTFVRCILAAFGTTSIGCSSSWSRSGECTKCLIFEPAEYRCREWNAGRDNNDIGFDDCPKCQSAGFVQGSSYPRFTVDEKAKQACFVDRNCSREDAQSHQDW